MIVMIINGDDVIMTPICPPADAPNTIILDVSMPIKEIMIVTMELTMLIIIMIDLN